MSDGSIASNRKVSRAKLLDCIRQFPAGSIVAMEACATSHYWGRTFHSMGFLVRPTPTQHVKALAHHQKNDANDARAICETAPRPGIHFVAVKTIEQQDIKALRSAHQLMVGNVLLWQIRPGHWRQSKGLRFPLGFMCYSIDYLILLKMLSN